MKIAIIGAGPAGLAAVKNCLDENVKCVAFEMASDIGGTWNYYEETEDENGSPLHSSMYANLITNIPKELLEFEGFHYQDCPQSYLSQQQVLHYIHRYAQDFKLLPYIKLSHKVELVEPLDNHKWTVQVRNLKTHQVLSGIYDGLMVCNGHYFDPFYPTIPGMEFFKHKSIHSHYFRRPNEYKGKKVLIIGGGFSGVDIARIVSSVAKIVYFSFRKQRVLCSYPLDNYIKKPGIDHLEDGRAMFLDGSQEDIDEIIYCTGYNYKFPFLTPRCHISVDNNGVQPLYKHLINIEHPSMAIINIFTVNAPFPLVGLQVRFFLALLKDKFHITKEEMYKDFMEDRQQRDKQGLTNRLAHRLADQQQEYCKDLAKIANIAGIRPVIGNLLKYILKYNPPRQNYRIINDEEFEVFPCQ